MDVDIDVVATHSLSNGQFGSAASDGVKLRV